MLNVPATGPDSITLKFVITAPGEDPSTNLITYQIVGPPANDMFTNAIKVPVAAAYYLSNNKLATREVNEPNHGGVTTSSKSLWWRYTANANTNVLVDAGGSDFRAIVAVYTNNSLASLGSVASGIGGISRLGPYVRFDAKNGVTYHIAVAGYDNLTAGTLRLYIAPGGQPDTNAPTVTVTTPPNGIIVTTNRLSVAGIAVDPQPNPAGIQDVRISVSAVPGAAPSSTIVVNPRSLIGPISTNWSAIVGLLPGANNIQVVARDFAGNLSVPVNIRALYRQLEPANDFFVNAFTLTNAGISSVNTLTATKETGEPNHVGNAGGKSAWWKFTAPSDGVLYLNTTNSTFDTLLAVYTGSTVSSLTEIASNDDAYDGIAGGSSLLNVAVRSNVTYRVAVDGFDGDGGVVFLTNNFTAATVYHVTVTSGAGGSVLPGSSDVVSNGTLTLTAVPDPYFLFDIWSGALSSLSNPLTVTVTSNLTLNAAFKAAAYTDGFETGGLTNIAWTTGGAQPWIVQTNVVAAGRFAARSGFITHNQSSSLFFTGNFSSGFITFDYKISSEPNFDTLRFFIDGVEIAKWSGEVGWANYAYGVGAGTHTVEWRYTKDPTLSAGADAAYLDNVILPLVVPVSTLAPARLTVRRLTDGTAFVDLQGQPDQTYVFQSSSDAVNWSSFSTNVALGGFTRAVDVNSRTAPKSFYRAFVPAH
ncbi:MAG: hypothetical protein EPO07_07285 [Verrucomicrobia bacterium]|nr:MAG: hypothetical protein EPO07_07285 [Verrucomicrobiota bacterium]